MTFREALVSGSGTPTWSIPLATHQRTDIPNLTMEPALVLAGPRKQAEVRFHKYRQRRPPTAGYNCFGHAFALRRTAIYDLDRTLLDTILDDDGYAEVADPDIEVGDIVMYFDDRGEPFHAGEVIRREPLLIGLSSAIASTVPIVLSKLDDISGARYRRRAIGATPGRPFVAAENANRGLENAGWPAGASGRGAGVSEERRPGVRGCGRGGSERELRRRINVRILLP